MKNLNIFVMSICMLFLFSVSAMAQENLDNWNEYVWPGGTGDFTSSTMGTSARLIATGGDETWGSLEKMFPGLSGMMATFNISTISGNASTGLRKNIGNLPNGNRIVLHIFLEQYSERKRVTYRVREEATTGEYRQVIARGNLGEYFGTWEEGQEVFLGFLFLDNEIWLASSTTEAYVKVMLWEPVTFSDTVFQIFADAWEPGDNSVDVTVSNVSVF